MKTGLRIVQSPSPAPSATRAPSTSPASPALPTSTGPAGLAGIVDVLAHDPAWAGVLGASELDQRIVFRSPPPLGVGPNASAIAIDRVGSPVGERDVDEMRLWFEETRSLSLSKYRLVDAMRIVAHRHAFHPVRQYLEGLSWDGVPRIDRWLEDYCAVVPESDDHAGLVRSVARKWLLSCVARAMKPGCKVDTMLILEGRQGIGKSTALSALAGEGLHSDAAIDFGTRDACQILQGVWIFELAELDAILRRDTSTIKAFLSRSTDRFRVPYGRTPECVPRSVVFCGTVNHGDYLRDTTGNRRFWVVRCEGPLNVEGLRAARDSLWAEALYYYQRGESWHLGAAHEAGMRDEHDSRVEQDPWEERLHAWVSPRTDENGELPCSMNEILELGLGLRASTFNPRITGRVSALLAKLGYRKRKRGCAPRAYYYERRPDPDGRAAWRPASPETLFSETEPAKGDRS